MTIIAKYRPLAVRVVSVALCFTLVNLCVPFGAVYTFGKPIAENLQAQLKTEEMRQADLSKRRAASQTRLLGASELKSLRGATGENPYLSGQNKWDVVYKGINLMSGNFSTSATDMSFEGGYGIPVNVTRSYSANNADEGPFGKGWTLSADVRSTAGGLLKNKSAPVRAVPSTLKDRPHLQLDDPNAVSANGVIRQPVEAVVSTDAGCKEETIQKDVDGILSTPPWDKNTHDAVYEFITLGGSSYQVLVSNTTHTPEGTTYVYAKEGSYPNGTKPWNNASATAEAANVLKVTSATDRQGNLTTYSYGTGWVTFQKSNGSVQEHPISKVQMPNGHNITFTWGDGSTGHPANRVWQIKDNSNARVVSYAYDLNGLLVSATTPGGKTTQYGYGSAVGTSPATNLLTSLRDPRGLVTTLTYMMASQQVNPYNVNFTAPICCRVIQPDGKTFYFCGAANGFVDDSNWPSSLGDGNIGVSQQWEEWAGPLSTGTLLHHGAYISGLDNNAGTIYFRTYENFGAPRGGPNEPNGRTQSLKTYDTATQNLVSQYSVSSPALGADLSSSRIMTVPSAVTSTRMDESTTYNFLGNPLSKTSTESYATGGVWTSTRTASVAYAYWGKEKYYQQKAVRDQAGRYSYTDYYDNLSAAGKRGQTYRVYDPKNASFVLDTTIIPPAVTPSANYWKYQLVPSSPSNYSAQFQYDSQGRPTDVYKLQSTITSPWTYVQTHTSYGADTDGSWGQAAQVAEDSGGINRVTQTLHYTSWGKADQVVDAAGHTFTTTYDLDGQVQSVSQTISGNTTPVANYTYGTTAPSQNGVDVTYGQVLGVTDNLSGVTESMSYAASGGGIGQVASVSESGGPNASYSTNYSYSLAGDRASAVYTTPNGTTTWQYADYVTVGDAYSPKRVFQTLRKLSSGNPTAEEFQYVYDAAGRPRNCAFAQTPASGFTPTGSNAWYDSTHRASVRARAYYLYDTGGRITSLEHYWDTWGGSAYTSEAILANGCSYEIGGAMNRGLKTASRLYTRTSAGSPAWTLAQTDTYSYDANLDYLTGASYGDGQANATPTWSYDAAGNRNDAVTDNLNRATSIGGVSCTNDILGNRLTKGSNTMTWDSLNRMLTYNSTSYVYRADGMRVKKSSATGSTVYRHDGQMGMEDVEVAGATTTVTDYAIGARGVDGISSAVNGGSSSVSYPIYDAHGNMISTLARNGTGYTYSATRGFDAWGVIRVGGQTGDPKGRYCANLGHKQDDESGLVYMRARYYEPTSGRFISEDSAMQGSNWYVYCGNNGINAADLNGRNWVAITGLGAFVGGCVAMDMAISVARTPLPWLGKLGIITAELNAAVVFFTLSFAMTGPGAQIGTAALVGITAAVMAVASVIQSIAAGLATVWADGLAAGVVVATAVYAVMLLALTVAASVEPFSGGDVWAS